MPEPHQNSGRGEGEFEKRPIDPAKPRSNPLDPNASLPLACDRDEMAKRFRIMIQREHGAVHDRNGRELFLRNESLVEFIRGQIFGLLDHSGQELKLNFEVTGTNQSGGYIALISVEDRRTKEYLLAGTDRESPPFSWGDAHRIPDKLFAGYLLQLTPVIGKGLSVHFSRILSPALFDAEFKKIVEADANSLVVDFLQGMATHTFDRKLDLSCVRVGEDFGSELKSLLIKEANGLTHTVIFGIPNQGVQMGLHSIDTFSNTRFVPSKPAREESLSGEFASFSGNHGYLPVVLPTDQFESQTLDFAIKSAFTQLFRANWNPDFKVTIHSLLQHPEANTYRALVTVNDRNLDSVLLGQSKGEIAIDPGILGFSVTIAMEPRALPEPSLWQRARQSISKLFGKPVETFRMYTQMHIGGLVASPRWIGEQMAKLSLDAESSFLFKSLRALVNQDLNGRGIRIDQPVKFSNIKIHPVDSEETDPYDYYKLLCTHQYGDHLIGIIQHRASGLIVSGASGFESLSFYKR